MEYVIIFGVGHVGEFNSNFVKYPVLNYMIILAIILGSIRVICFSSGSPGERTIIRAIIPGFELGGYFPAVSPSSRRPGLAEFAVPGSLGVPEVVGSQFY